MRSLRFSGSANDRRVLVELLANSTDKTTLHELSVEERLLDLSFDERASILVARQFRARGLQPPGGGPGGGGGGGGGGTTTTTNARACPLLGTIGTTTVAGTDTYTPSISWSVGTTIAGPFEAGFDSQIDSLLSWLGCSPASLGYLDGGIDTQTSLEAVAHSCGVALPRVASGNFISLMWAAGAHSPPNSAGCTSPPGGLSGYTACTSPNYHFHQVCHGGAAEKTGYGGARLPP